MSSGKSVFGQGPKPEAEMQRTDRMTATLKLAVESLECDAADAKIQRLIKRLKKDIQEREKLQNGSVRAADRGDWPVWRPALRKS